ncbi:DUF1611 domain-containing protein [Microcella daejeonensis]|uniref:DUF1611 domain-containing protein n=1 Tax=Microcella daejeonensis TaxID=2994971 RepID=A0A9E8S836_9MICO|nr:DUF1611 domain-containing protein [Microcella daejeonensis]WAB80813.1 DUF1611 domain-containing protein [Microcella daejeonensis]WAB82992.1 DUF1611 domain-containing protein [Microcella daejeonensis]
MTITALETAQAAPVETGAPIARARVERAKRAYSTRHVPLLGRDDLVLLADDGLAPRAGDVVLARVEEIGQHRRLEGVDSRRQTILPGDEIIVLYGNRYASDQFLAIVPDTLEPCHLVAGGGLAALVQEQHDSIAAATSITPLGVLGDAHGRLRLDRAAPHAVVDAHRVTPSALPPVIAVLGSAMNSGKTTALASLAGGLSAAGLVVAAGKATGTCSGNDPHRFRDFGARRALDFTDFGLPTTFGAGTDRIRDLFASMVAELAADEPDVILIEVADGILHTETADLIADPVFARVISSVVFAAQDALGALAAIEQLTALGMPISAVTGVLTSSPLAVAEARRATTTPIVATDHLREADVARALTMGSGASA